MNVLFASTVCVVQSYIHRDNCNTSLHVPYTSPQTFFFYFPQRHSHNPQKECVKKKKEKEKMSMIENNVVRTWRSTTNMHGDRRHQRSDWAAHRKRKVEEVSGSRSPAICSDPSNQKSTWFKLASRLKQAEHPRQPLLNGSERSVAILFTPWGWFYSSPGTGDWVAGPVPESLLVKVSAKKKNPLGRF